MKQHYKDIIERAGDPHWFDEYGCPRYGKYGPNKVANIYTDVVVFAKISCQGCGENFIVAFSERDYGPQIHKGRKPLLELAKDLESLSYGDPPNVKCCPAGPTMMSETEEILEIWQRNHEDWKWEKINQ